MGNCAGYCNGENNETGQIRNSFKEGGYDDPDALEREYGAKKGRPLGKGMTDGQHEEQADEYGRVNKGPFTLRNGATYTG